MTSAGVSEGGVAPRPGWAQIIKMRVKPNRQDDLLDILKGMHPLEQPDSGLLRSTAMRDQKDPNLTYAMIVFENEEQARARERDPRRREQVQAVQGKIPELLDGPPEFIDLDILDETYPASGVARTSTTERVAYRFPRRPGRDRRYDCRGR